MKQAIVILLLSLPALLQGQSLTDSTKAYSKFDFLPGNQVIYFNDFQQDALGELPTGWNTTGSGEVVTLNNRNWIKLLQNAIFITDNTQPFSENFSVELDVLLDFKDQNAFFPLVSLGILSSGTAKPNANSVLQNMQQNNLVAVDLNANIEQHSYAKIISYSKGSEYFSSGEKPFKQLQDLLQQTIHISIQVQKERFRFWINEYKLFDIPNALAPGAAINQLFFSVAESGYNNDQIGVYVSNIKVAKGFPDTRNKLLTEGKFSTTGILFDVNAAVIKPSSYGVIKEIAGVLQLNPSIKILVIGHTDADGNEADNLELSKRRSEAVKQMLVKEFGLDPSAISTAGKGESAPIASNDTKEGKAQNRRVEFIKQ